MKGLVLRHKSDIDMSAKTDSAYHMGLHTPVLVHGITKKCTYIESFLCYWPYIGCQGTCWSFDHSEPVWHAEISRWLC